VNEAGLGALGTLALVDGATVVAVVTRAVVSVAFSISARDLGFVSPARPVTTMSPTAPASNRTPIAATIATIGGECFRDGLLPKAAAVPVGPRDAALVQWISAGTEESSAAAMVFSYCVWVSISLWSSPSGNCIHS
jgi:hypothetical protein